MQKRYDLYEIELKHRDGISWRRFYSENMPVVLDEKIEYTVNGRPLLHYLDKTTKVFVTRVSFEEEE